MQEIEKADSLKIDALNQYVKNALNLANISKGKLHNMSFSETLQEALKIIKLSNPDISKVYQNKTVNKQHIIKT